MIVKSEKILKIYRLEGPCELCGRWLPRREVHHVHHRGHGGGSRLDIPQNLLSLCPHWQGNDCHRLKGDDPAYRATFLHMLAVREGFLSGDDVWAYLLAVLALPKGSKIPAAPVCP